MENEHQSLSQDEEEPIVIGPKVIRIITATSLGLFIILVAYLGFQLGMLKICHDLDGFLDEDKVCHLDYDPNPDPIGPDIDVYGNNFSIGDLNVNVSS